MIALITGGSGFIGSHLVDALLAKKWSVRCLVRPSSSNSWLKGLPIEHCAGDCRCRKSLREAVRGVDFVFHLAGVTTALDARTYFEVNAFGTDTLLRACVESNPGVKRFIYVSSQAAAGPSDGVAITEADRCEPVSNYGRSKRRGEEFAFGQAANIPVVVIRPPIVYGPRDRGLFPFFKFLSRGIQPRLAGGRQRFSICYVEDVVRGLLLASEKEEARGEIFFLSDGQNYSWNEIGDAFSGAVGRRVLEIPVSKTLVRAGAVIADLAAAVRGRPGLLNLDKLKEVVQPGWVCDSGKAERLLGFEPRVGLSEGARLTFEWYNDARWI